jgi:hypothetical protein
MTDEEHRQINVLVSRLNGEQRSIVLGTIAVLQAFDDKDAARRWLQRYREAILAEVRHAAML